MNSEKLLSRHKKSLTSTKWGTTRPVPWNGTESLHGRSTWGVLSFDLADADRARILRAQIFKTANAYKAEKVARTADFTGGQDWRDLRFTVDRLRAAYVTEKLSEEK